MKNLFRLSSISKSIITLNTGIAVIYFWFVIKKYLQGLSYRADFTAFYTGWTMVREGVGTKIYDFGLQIQYQHRILDKLIAGNGILAFYYPPHVALIFSPLSYLPLNAAYVTWSFGQLLLLIWFISYMRRQTKIEGWTRREQFLLFSAILAMPSLMITFQLGTFSLIMLIALMGFTLALKHGRDTEAALWLVLGSIKPQIMIIPGVALLFSRRWKALGIGVAIMMVVIWASSLKLGWKVWPEFLNAVARAYTEGQSFGVIPVGMYNFKGMLSVLLGSQQIDLINKISSVAFVLTGTIIALMWGRLGREKHVFDLLMALTVILGTVFGLHVNPQDGLLVAVPAILFYNYLREGYRYLRVYAAFVLLCPFVFFVWRYFLQSAIRIQVPTVAMMVLGLWVATQIVNWWRNTKLPDIAKEDKISG